MDHKMQNKFQYNPKKYIINNKKIINILKYFYLKFFYLTCDCFSLFMLITFIPVARSTMHILFSFDISTVK